MKSQLFRLLRLPCIFLLLIVALWHSPQRLSAQQIVGYSYWFDHQNQTQTYVSMSPQPGVNLQASLPTDGLKAGIHSLHLQFTDDSGKKSSIISQHFVKTAGVSAYMYWFNDDTGNTINQSLSPSAQQLLNLELPAGGLKPGRNILHMRFRDQAGAWSAVKSHMFWYQGGGLQQFVYWFDNQAEQIVTGQMQGETSEDWLLELETPPGFGFDAMHARFLDASGLWSIPASLPPPAPLARFLMLRDGYFVSFNNTTLLGKNYLWSFGDGIESNQVNPSHTYSAPGDYLVRLIASNAGGADTLDQMLIIRGIQSSVPASAGNAGYATITVYGGGLAAQSQVRLTAPGLPDLLADTAYMEAPGRLAVRFDLTGKPLGMRNLVISIPGHEDLLASEALEIVEGIAPKVTAQLSGQPAVLVNRWTTHSLQYSNLGNMDAYIVPVWLLVSDIEGLEIEFISKPPSLPLMEEEIWQTMLDSVPMYIPVDSLNGQPFKARAYPLYLPLVKAGESGNFTFRIKAPSSYQIYSWVDGNYITDPKLSDYQICIMWAQAEALTNGLVNLITSQIPGAGCVVAISQMYLNFDRSSATLGSVCYALTRAAVDCVWDVGSEIPWVKAYSLTKEILSLAANIYEAWEASEECKRLFKPGEAVQKPVAVVNSLDPNDISGPEGYGQQRYYTDQAVYPYLIRFENMDDATAPAQEVFISDTLDTSVFDLASFQLGNIGFGDHHIYLNPGLQSFTTDIDLRPEKNIILRINASLDLETGVVDWVFRSLDPQTMDLTEDAFGGFLPPNVNAPEGEGYVSYSIQPKSGLTHMDVLEARARIVFDLNEAIYTNIWSNTLDKQAPECQVEALAATTDNEIFQVSWMGTDNHSGIGHYAVYVSKDSGAASPWKEFTWHQTGLFEGEYGSTYRFYCLATDKLGNQGVFDGNYQAATTLVDPSSTGSQAFGQGLRLYPNPASSQITIDYPASCQPDRRSLYIQNLLGNTVWKTDLTQSAGQLRLDTQHFASGTYFISLSEGNQKISLKFIISR